MSIGKGGCARWRVLGIRFLVVVGIEKTIMTCYTTGLVLDKNLKNPVSVFRVFDLLFIHIKPYESELSTALSECKAVARCATRKTNTAINRIKTVGACKNCGHYSGNTYGCKHVPNVFSVYCSIVGKCCFAAPIYLFKDGCREFTLVKPTLNK